MIPKQSLLENKSPILKGEKKLFILDFLKNIYFRVFIKTVLPLQILHLLLLGYNGRKHFTSRGGNLIKKNKKSLLVSQFLCDDTFH